MIDFRSLRDIRKESPQEFWLAVVTAIFVVVAGVEQGIVLADDHVPASYRAPQLSSPQRCHAL